MEANETYRQPPQILEPNADWKIFFTSKRGRSHVAAGKVCQDYCIAEKITEKIFVVAVADGHGGDAYVKSDIGSREACNLIVSLAKKYSDLSDRKFLDKWTSPEFKEELFDSWQAAVLADYRSENPDAKNSDAEIIKKYGTTLLFAAVTEFNIILGQVGDGAILFFNDQNQSQLFKRHNPKFDSKTSSLASGRGIYSLHIESYRRLSLKFNKILLSTDGIYDKLDRGNSFELYANALAAQIRNKPVEEIQPFTIDEIDVSEKSSDDCTVAAIISPPSDKKYEFYFPDIAQILADLKFERAYTLMEIYSARKDNVIFELHSSKRLFKRDYIFDELDDKIKLLKPAQANSINNIFELPAGLFRVWELIEHGEHLEKRYIPDDDEPQRFSNEFWLYFYETILELKKLFAEKNYFAEENFFKTMLISESGEIFLFEDCLSNAIFYADSSRKLFETVESYFSFLGKIICGEKSLPLFKCPRYSAGQIISKLHTSDGKAFGRIVYNPVINSYGLQNLSEKIWLAENKQVKPNQILKITGNHVLKIPDEENISYEIKLFATE